MAFLLLKFNYEIVKKGHKCLEGCYPESSFKVQIEINDLSKDWQVGDVVEFYGKKDEKRNRFGAKVKVFPRTLSETEDKAMYITDNLDYFFFQLYSNAFDNCFYFYKEKIIKQIPKLEEIDKKIAEKYKQKIYDERFKAKDLEQNIKFITDKLGYFSYQLTSKSFDNCFSFYMSKISSKIPIFR